MACTSDKTIADIRNRASDPRFRRRQERMRIGLTAVNHQHSNFCHFRNPFPRLSESISALTAMSRRCYEGQMPVCVQTRVGPAHRGAKAWKDPIATNFKCRKYYIWRGGYVRPVADLCVCLLAPLSLRSVRRPGSDPQATGSLL